MSAQVERAGRIRYSLDEFGARLWEGGLPEAHIARCACYAGVALFVTANRVLRPPDGLVDDYADTDGWCVMADGTRHVLSIKGSSLKFNGVSDFRPQDCLLMSVQDGRDPYEAASYTLRVSRHEKTPLGVVVAKHEDLIMRMVNDPERGSYVAAFAPRRHLRSLNAFFSALAPHDHGWRV